MNPKTMKRLAPIGALAAMMLLSTGSLAAAETEGATASKETSAVQAVPAQKPIVYANVMNDGLLANPAHARNYWKLLVGAYAPDQSGAWNAALEERKQVEETFPKLKASKTIRIQGSGTGVIVGEAKDKADEVNPADAEASEKQIIKIPDKNEGGDIPQIIKVQKATDVDGKSEMKELPAHIQRQIKLGEAVEAGDADAIRALLPDLLNDYRQETQKQKEIQEKLKVAEEQADKTNP
ncbi:hypothetical protein [Paenibacillus hamazuiensis]|uniref:hypothetical protein n=1 Tax=Paenibacillus hamazuiensis TaxID=2936508 RepID=UPI00200D8C30|nr:hypothetical protein [Paenibacillus hamazuiensis]